MNVDKVLVICPVSPVPVVGGRQLRSFHLLRQLQTKYSLVLLAGYRNHEEREALGALAQMNALVVEAFPVRRTRGRILRRVWAPIASRRDPALGARVRKLVHDGYSVVKFDTLAAAAYFQDAEGAALRWLDQQNVENEVLRRRANQRMGLSKWTGLLAAAALAREERSLVRGMDVVTAVSEKDANVFRAWGQPAQIVPNGVEVPESPVPSPHPAHMLFVGPMSYPPNWEAVCWCLREVWPGVRQKLPHAIFHLVGRVTENQKRELRVNEGVRVHGFMENLDDAYRLADILVIPLLTGGGTKLKVLEGMAYGKAIVGSPVAWEGLDIKQPEQALQATRPEEFIRHILTLMQDSSRTKMMGEQARQAVAERYTWSQCGYLQSNALQDALGKEHQIN